MITGIDHLVLLSDSIESGTAAFSTFSGRPPDWRSDAGDGSSSAFFQLDSGAVEIMAPLGSGSMAGRLRTLIGEGKSALQTLVFATDDLPADHARLAAAGLDPGPIGEGASIDQLSGAHRKWRRFRLGQGSGLPRTFLLEREIPDPVVPGAPAAGALLGVDHLVIRSRDADRALHNYADRLGLGLALDRTAGPQGTRLLVFRCGGCGIEVACSAPDAAATEDDRLWGITWRTADIEAAHRRMLAAGFNVSEVRQGLRRGTRVFTVRDGTFGVPTLILAHQDD